MFRNRTISACARSDTRGDPITSHRSAVIERIVTHLWYTKPRYRKPAAQSRACSRSAIFSAYFRIVFARDANRPESSRSQGLPVVEENFRSQNLGGGNFPFFTSPGPIRWRSQKSLSAAGSGLKKSISKLSRNKKRLRRTVPRTDFHTIDRIYVHKKELRCHYGFLRGNRLQNNVSRYNNA